jgi:hypothetical protein
MFCILRATGSTIDDGDLAHVAFCLHRRSHAKQEAQAMDMNRFAALPRALAHTHARRAALGVLLAGALSLREITSVTAGKKGKGKGKGKGKKKKGDCSGAGRCPLGYLCHHGRCEPGCRDWPDCPEGMRCNLVSYQCARSCSGSDNFFCPNGEACHGYGGVLWCGTPCGSDADCPVGYVDPFICVVDLGVCTS